MNGREGMGAGRGNRVGRGPGGGRGGASHLMSVLLPVPGNVRIFSNFILPHLICPGPLHIYNSMSTCPGGCTQSEAFGKTLSI